MTLPTISKAIVVKGMTPALLKIVQFVQIILTISAKNAYQDTQTSWESVWIAFTHASSVTILSGNYSSTM